jgi:hypothetical protein
MDCTNRDTTSFLNYIPMYLSEMIDKFIFKIPSNIKEYIVKMSEYINILIGCLVIYVPFAYLHQRDSDLNEDDILSYKRQ